MPIPLRQLVAQSWPRRPITTVTSMVVFAIALGTLFHYHSRSTPLITTGPPIKVMIVGDSISHGWEGDYTWRYRLWEWIQSTGVLVDFVGSYTGTQLPDDDTRRPISPPRLPTDFSPTFVAGGSENGGYAKDASRDFDSDHFAAWGRQTYKVKDLIEEQVEYYSPDYLLVELGFNDLGWFFGAEDTLTSMESLVINSRAANPNIKFAIANVPQRTLITGSEDIPIKTDQYNKLLAEAIAKWSTELSPVELVKFRENYDCESKGCPSGHDGLHPNARGEYQIAQAFSRVLSEKYGLGQEPLAIPKRIPKRPCTPPKHVYAEPSTKSTNLTWDAVYGSYGYEMQNRMVGLAWPDLFLGSFTNHFETTWTVDGKEWEFRIRSVCGEELRSKWSRSISVVTPKPAELPPAR